MGLFLVRALEIAQEINEFYEEKISLAEFVNGFTLVKDAIHELRVEVEQFAYDFPMPGI